MYDMSKAKKNPNYQKTGVTFEASKADKYVTVQSKKQQQQKTLVSLLK